ncbi:MAG: ubiquinol-cytochrome c reductase iron-sulfur subunit [Chromatiales bacterium]|nr:ubiquinol-cytochrome c reductase iron-sulfur subunit [Chromatiales bacterium]
MSSDSINRKRRNLLIATTAVGTVGAVYAAVPFVASMQPSDKARAAGAPVDVDIGKLQPGQRITIQWRGKPVWIVRRTEAMLASLPVLAAQLRDPGSEKSEQPDSCRNEGRAIRSEYLVVVGICTHLGCAPTFRPDVAPDDLGPDWKGGFFCPCHGSRFDLSGRVYKSVPAPTNLVIPPYRYLSDTEIKVGEAEGVA